MSVANECIPKYEPGQRITGEATAAVTGKRVLRISADRTDEGNISVAHANAEGPIIGVASHDAASGDLVTVIGSGAVVPIDPSADVTAGDEVVAAASGKVAPVSEAGAAATVTVGSGNSKVKVTANEVGEGGNAITLTIVDPGGTTASLAVDTDNEAITVSLARASSAITSTAADVIAAINEHDGASRLVTASNGASSNGTGTAAAASSTPLTG